MHAVLPRILPTVLRPTAAASELTGPELAAAVLDGDLLRLGDAFLPIDAPAGPAQRAAVLRPLLPPGAVVAQKAAAWVWGAQWRLDTPVASYIGLDIHTPSKDPTLVTVHQVALTADDVLEIDGLQMTSPMRTAIDLARTSERDFDQLALGRLLAITGLEAAAVIDELLARPRIPRRVTALRRLQVLFTR